VIADGGYTDEQLYNRDETALYYKLLLNKSLDLKQASSKVGMKTNKERVTLLLCTNKTGDHKMKPLCISKSQSPQCLHANMNSQPVIYKNSSCAWMTCDIFASWFENEFVPSVKCHMHSKKLEEKALSLLDQCPAHPSADVLKSKDEKIKAMFLPKNTTALIQPMDQGIIFACKAYYRCELLGGVVNSELQVTEFLKTLMLKDVVYSVGLA
jgi:hypothetical protein